jgi:phage tail sheath gpL-like
MSSAITCLGASTGICAVDGTAYPNLAGYTATVKVTNAGTAFNAANGTAYRNDAVQQIDVTVSRGGESVTLTSYRFRYAPNSL